MPTPEQIRRMRELYEERKKREAQLIQAGKAGPGGPGGPAGGPTGGLYGKVIKPIITSPQFERALEFPRRGMAELIQRGAEMGEVGGPPSTALGGLLSGRQASLLGREALSDILDVAADIRGGPIPEEWGERMDPSRDTEIGAKILAEKEARIKEKGGEPLTYSEEYDVITQVQDEAMPWLTKRWGPAILPPDDEGGPRRKLISSRGLMELGGEMAVGAASLAVPPLAAGKIGTTGLKLASQAGRLAPGVRAATRATQEAIQIPRRFEQLADAIVGKPLGLGFKWGVGKPIAAATRVSMSTIRNLTNRFKGRALDEGLPPEQAAQLEKNLAQQAVDEGRVTDKAPGQKVTTDDLRDGSIPQKTYGMADENLMGIEAIEVPTARTGGPTKFELAIDKVRDAGRSTMEFFGRGVGAPKPSRAMERLGRIAKDHITRWSDGTQNRIEVWSGLKSRQVKLIVDRLEQAGVVESQGKMTDRQAAALDRNPTSGLSDGSTNESVRLSEQKGNYVFVDTYFEKSKDSSVRRMTFKGHTLTKTADGRFVDDPDLAPGFADVVERLNPSASHPGYRKQLAAITDIGTPEERALFGRSALEWVEELSAIGKLIEEQNIRLGRVNPLKRAFGITTYHFPRGASVEGAPLVDAGFSPDVSTIGKAGRVDYERDWVSQAQAMAANEQAYIHPAEAVRDHARNIGRAIRDRRYADFVKAFAEENDLTHGTIKELLERSTGYRAYLKALDAMRVTVQARLARMSDRQKQMWVWVPVARVKLPKNLAGAAPRMRPYGGRGGVNYELTFESDIDKALYIVSQKTPSDHDADYLAWLKTFAFFKKYKTGDLRSAGAAVRKYIRSTVAGKSAAEPVAIPTSQITKDVTKRFKATGKYVLQDRPIFTLAKKFINDAETDNLDHMLAEEGTATTYLKDLGEKIDARNKTLRELEEGLMAPSEKGPSQVFRRRQVELAETSRKVVNETEKDLSTWIPENFAPGDLGGQYFPWEYFGEINKAFADIAGLEDPYGRGLKSAAFIVQGLMKQIGATADLSSPGIQGLVHLWYDAGRLTAGRGILRAQARIPGERGRRAVAELKLQPQGNAFKAVREMVRAGFRTQESGERIINEGYVLFDVAAKKSGTLTSIDWGKLGLAIREHAVDYTLGARSRGVAGRLGSLPGLKQAERMFNHYGNQIRLYGANRELELQMVLTGKTAKELAEDGTAASIASVMNTTTGIGRRRFMGNFGQFIFFAPSFFNARLRVVGQYAGKGTKMERFIARRYINGYLAMATTTTLALNEAMGEETDINPFSFDDATGKWRFNPNFMRVKMGHLHISLFGPWDTMLRIASVPFFVTANQRLGWDRKQLVRDLRAPLSAPITGVSLEWLTGEDAMGRKSGFPTTFDEEAAEGDPTFQDWAIEHLVPFAWQEVLFAEPGTKPLTERIVEGTAGERFEAAGQFALQMFGGKSSYETPYESMQKAFAEIIELGPDDPRIQKAFGVAQGLKSYEELKEFYAEYGKGIFGADGGNWSLSLLHIGKEGTPTFDDIARDITKNLERLIEKGQFADIMTPEELEQLKDRTAVRLQRSSKKYDQYRVARDKIVDEEEVMLTDIMEHFERGERTFGNVEIGDIDQLLGLITATKRDHSRRKAALTKKDGPFESVRDIFDYANQTALGNLSTFDSDLYDTAQALYYETLYGDDSIIDEKTDVMDWEAYEQRINEFGGVLARQFPAMSSVEVNTMLYRVQDAARREAPPIVEILLKGKDFLTGNKWHQVYDDLVENYSRTHPTENRGAIIEDYRGSGRDGKAKMREDHPWLNGAEQAVQRYRRNLRANDERLDGIAMMLAKSTSPVTRRGRQVQAIIRAHTGEGSRPLDDWLDFFGAVYRGESLDRYLGGVRLAS